MGKLTAILTMILTALLTTTAALSQPSLDKGPATKFRMDRTGCAAQDFRVISALEGSFKTEKLGACSVSVNMPYVAPADRRGWVCVQVNMTSPKKSPWVSLVTFNDKNTIAIIGGNGSPGDLISFRCGKDLK